MATKRRMASQGVKLEDFEVDQQDGIARRIAKCLAWYAEKAPGRCAKLPELYKVVEQKGRKPAEDSREIARFRGQVQRANALLREEYGLHLKYIRGMGVRATFDDDDKLSIFEQRNKRVARAIALREQTSSTINAANISDKDKREWFKGQMAQNSRLAAAMKRLELPAPSEEEAE